MAAKTKCGHKCPTEVKFILYIEMETDHIQIIETNHLHLHVKAIPFLQKYQAIVNVINIASANLLKFEDSLHSSKQS